MANLPETSVWEDGVYEIQSFDPVQGAVGNNLGVVNIPSQTLTNRTRFLRDRLETLEGVSGGNFTDLQNQVNALPGQLTQQIDADGSWRWLTASGGYFSWRSGILSYNGPCTPDHPNLTGANTANIQWLTYSVMGGAAGVPGAQLLPSNITGGTRVGQRSIWARDAGGTLRHYYTVGRSDFNFQVTNEIVTEERAQSIIADLSGGLQTPVMLDTLAMLPTTGMTVGMYFFVQNMINPPASSGIPPTPNRSGKVWWGPTTVGGTTNGWNWMLDGNFAPDGETITFNASGSLQISQTWQTAINTAFATAQAAMPRAGGIFAARPTLASGAGVNTALGLGSAPTVDQTQAFATEVAFTPLGTHS